MECHGPVVWRTAKYGFRKCGQGDLLVQELFMLLKLRGLGQVRFKDTVSGQIAAVERIQEISEPSVGSRRKSLKNGMQQEFPEIVNGIRD